MREIYLIPTVSVQREVFQTFTETTVTFYFLGIIKSWYHIGRES